MQAPLISDITIPTGLLLALGGAIVGYLWRGLVEFWRFNKWMQITKAALDIEGGEPSSQQQSPSEKN